jgi:hypothetical protein
MAVCRCANRTSTTSPVRPTELKLPDAAAELIAVARSQRETRRRIGRPAPLRWAAHVLRSA